MSGSKKSDSIWYPRYPGDYQRKTSHLSLTEHGVYAVLLDHYYATGRPLPVNAMQVQRICRAFEDHEVAAMQEILSRFFVKRETGYHNERADEELARRGAITQKRRLAANLKHATDRAYASNAAANACAFADTVTATSTVKESSIEDSLDGLAIALDGKEAVAGNSASKKQAIIMSSAIFEKWWQDFPRTRRGSKVKALHAWKRIVSGGTDPNVILAGLSPYLTCRDVAEGFACGATVWLNNERWNDQPQQAGTKHASNRRTGPNVSEQADALLYRKYGLDKPTDAGVDRTDQFIPGTVLDA